MIRLLIVEDQTIVLSALSALLSLEPDITVVATATNGVQALHACETHDIDIVLSDIEMPEMDGLTLAKSLQLKYPTIKTIILTTFSKSGYIKRSQDAKVHGYLLKDSPTETLVKTIRKVSLGEVVIAPELMTQVWQSNIDPLSEKEKALLVMAHQGKTTKEIALIMHLSNGTIRNYLHSACQKLHVNNRIEAANVAYRMGWL